MNTVADFLLKKTFPVFNISDFSIYDSCNEITLYVKSPTTLVCSHRKSHKVVVHK